MRYFIQRSVQHLWCLPLTLGALCVIGTLLAGVALWRARRATQHVGRFRIDLATSGERDAQRSGVWITSPSIAYLLNRHPAGPMEAAVTGHIVWAMRTWDETPESIRAHELTHVHQSLRWGILFPLAYLASSWLARRRGLDPYWNNVFEIEARAAERA